MCSSQHWCCMPMLAQVATQMRRAATLQRQHVWAMATAAAVAAPVAAAAPAPAAAAAAAAWELWYGETRLVCTKEDGDGEGNALAREVCSFPEPHHASPCTHVQPAKLADAPHAARGSAKKLGPKVDALVRLYDNHRHSHGCALCSRLCKTSVHNQEGTRICPTTKQTTHARQL